jgi:transcriptional regulator with XRE-family HTH domain
MAPSVKKLRSRLSLTQETFGRLLGWSFVTINRWEHGATPRGLNGAVLQLLSNAIDAHGPDEVVEALRDAHGAPIDIIRTLCRLERTGGT